jgi:hypothetical protein
MMSVWHGRKCFGGDRKQVAVPRARCPSTHNSQISGSYSYLHSQHVAPTDRPPPSAQNTLPHARRSEPFVHRARPSAIELHLCRPCLVLYCASAGLQRTATCGFSFGFSVGRPVHLIITSVLQRLSLPRGLCFASYPATVSCSASHAGLVIQLPLWS